MQGGRLSKGLVGAVFAAQLVAGLACGQSGGAATGIGDASAGGQAGDGRWIPMNVANAPTPGPLVLHVWTGQELLVFSPQDGGAFDPRANRWRPLSVAGMPADLPSPRVRSIGNYGPLLAGDHVVVLYPDTKPAITAAVYDVKGDRWTVLPIDGSSPSPRTGAVTAWTGSKLIVWGGEGGGKVVGDGALLDPVAGRFSPMTSTGAPSPRKIAAAAWTGSRLVVFSGVGEGDDWIAGCKMCGGGIYDPATDQWVRLATEGAPDRATRLFWTGKRVIAGVSGDALFDPAANRWEPTGDRAALSMLGSLGYASWIEGDRFVTLAGPGRSGAVADLDLRSWETVPPVTFPDREGYGGYFIADDRRLLELKLGRLYPPARLTNRDEVQGGWMATVSGRQHRWEIAQIPELNSPPSLVGGVIVWTGSQLIVWGGMDRQLDPGPGDDSCRNTAPCDPSVPTRTTYHREGGVLSPAFMPL